MNFYAFHIGDYASATRHLSWEEDCAYRRLLDVYYTREEPLPDDLRAICRLVVASTPDQRQAVEVVLHEFFHQTEAGWISPRADREIDAMRVKQSAQEEKNQHESERMRRYRERRAAMFDALRVYGVVPAWDVSMKELQRLHDATCNAKPKAPAADLQREQVVSGDAPATAISTNPNPITNTNVDTPLTPQGGRAGFDPLDPLDPDDLPEPHDLPRNTGNNSHHLAGAVCLLAKRMGIALVNPGNSKLNALLNAGASVAQFEGAIQKAMAGGKNFSYALSIVEREEKEARELVASLGSRSRSLLDGARAPNKQEALEQRNRAIGREAAAAIRARAAQQGEVHAS
ncbi:YdaU family protein [Acidovorax sp. CCYZU-2555]|uniref:YdaU family protein n=1 Tax=Acidovorax sp. CCYZU-2555 TaxID=2835042 RepID=UPI001BCAEAB2|nr:YdaU family protein [Acidovorax sp. CCYZU-2555]MBS7777677.1 YdaU family protein [Acidovorax sp. CCYZU-2555]